MSLVNWDQEVKITGEAERDQELLLATLKTNLVAHQKWQGKVIKKRNSTVVFVELRKLFRGSANVLIVVANHGWADYNKGQTFKSTAGLNIRMSMNSALMMTFEDMNEMNLAILEAQGVLDNANASV